MMAVGWSNPQIGEAVLSSLKTWAKLHLDLTREFTDRHGSSGPFSAEDIAALVASVYVGVAALKVLHYESCEIPLRPASSGTAHDQIGHPERAGSRCAASNPSMR